MEYELIRSKRKSVTIRITACGNIEVRAPLRLAKGEIDKIVAEKNAWIVKHINNACNNTAKRESFSLTYGKSVLYRGSEYAIVACNGKKAYFDESFFVPNGLQEEEIKLAVLKIYKRLAKEYINSRVLHFLPIVGVTPASIKINSAKRQWGSCSGKNSLNFSWRLVLASDETIDYVVVHELCHIKQHNHSNRFWTCVAQILPNYKNRQSGLKLLQQRLDQENWE